MTTNPASRIFIERNARPLDLARWSFHFESGSKEAVLKALTAYQNPDGGFGHALEPDCFNPESSPIQTWVAMEILEEIECQDPAHPIIQGILKYLESGTHFDGHFWRNTISSNNDHPHAPWWSDNGAPCNIHDYNPTAYLAGFILRHASKDSLLYQTGHRIAQEAIDAYNTNYPSMEMHLVYCFAHLAQDLDHLPTIKLNHVEAFKANLSKRIDELITKDLGRWDQGYVCFPNRFITTKDSPYYPKHTQSVLDFCDYLRKVQNPDGTWPVTWSWPSYPENWPIAKLWWQSDILINNLRFLKTFDPK